MARRIHYFSLLMKVDPKEASHRLKTLYVENRCSLHDAAKALRCGRRAFLLWCRKLGIEEWLHATAKIARRDGWFHQMKGAHLRASNNRVTDVPEGESHK